MFLKISVKKFNELDIDELYDFLKLRSEVFVVEQQCIYPDIDSIDKIANHLLAYVENELVGYLRIYTKEHSFPIIGRVVIKKQFRNKRYAKLIMKAAINFIETTSSNKTIKISAQEYLKEFYQKLNFKQNGDSYLDYGIPHIDMQLNLKNEN